MNIRRVPSCGARVSSYPPGEHPVGCPIVNDLTAVCIETPSASRLFKTRWYGVRKAWIGSDLNFYIAGFNRMFKEITCWPEPSNDMRDECKRFAGCPDCGEVEGSHKARCAQGALS